MAEDPAESAAGAERAAGSSGLPETSHADPDSAPVDDGRDVLDDSAHELGGTGAGPDEIGGVFDDTKPA
ncbi:MAG: hypothetical protein JOY61_16370, partial [Chloroflexi bacterium]|nr:hypothetical protein [Chloroflexota bacterium]